MRRDKGMSVFRSYSGPSLAPTFPLYFPVALGNDSLGCRIKLEIRCRFEKGVRDCRYGIRRRWAGDSDGVSKQGKGRGGSGSGSGGDLFGN